MTAEYDTYERGTELSEPRELYQFSHGSTFYFACSGDRDITWNGQLYTAQPSARLGITVSTTSADLELVVVLPATHPLVQRFMAQASPPQRVLATISRMQLGIGEVEQLWAGYISSIAFDRHAAKLRVVSLAQQALLRRLPIVLCGDTCPNVLYDAWCRADPAGFTLSTTCATVNGRDLTVASMSGNPDQWAQFGQLVHVASGERQTIATQVGTSISMLNPIFELHSGDAVQVIAGCAHDIFTCRDKFANVVNYAGFPQRPLSDPFLPTGFGVIEQT